MRRGKLAGPNPWHANTLEWQTTSPPPHENFVGRVPTVYRGPYEYSVAGPRLGLTGRRTKPAGPGPAKSHG